MFPGVRHHGYPDGTVQFKIFLNSIEDFVALKLTCFSTYMHFHKGSIKSLDTVGIPVVYLYVLNTILICFWMKHGFLTWFLVSSPPAIKRYSKVYVHIQLK